MKRNPDERFWDKVEKTETCWLWRSTRNASGYGTFTADGRRWMAHRYAYEALVGPIPEGLELDHVCRMRSCVNPSHLEAVTSAENKSRSPIGINTVRRVRPHCLHGHPWTEETTYRGVYKGQPYRSCRICKNLQGARSYQRRRERGVV
jgi:hypothetical protein